MRAFAAVALPRTGRIMARGLGASLLFQLETHSWLLDYYQVHIGLAELHLAVLNGRPSR